MQAGLCTPWSSFVPGQRCIGIDSLVKKRKPHKFMRSYYGIIPETVLNRERVKVENNMEKHLGKARYPMLTRYMLIDPKSYINDPSWMQYLRF